MLFQQNFRHFYNVSGLGGIQIDRFHVRHQAFHAQLDHRFGSVGDRIEFFGRLVDGDIRCLC